MHHREQGESEEQWERRRVLERRREDALRLANEKVNVYGPAFVDASAMADRDTVVETFYQVRRTGKLLADVYENLYSFVACMAARRHTLPTVEQRHLAEAICAAEDALDLIYDTGYNLKRCLDRE